MILNSSKTYAEVASFAKRHNITHPFITENGSVIYVPRNYFDFSFENYELRDNYHKIVLGSNVQALKNFLDLKRIKHYAKNCTFLHQMNIKEALNATNLNSKNIKLSLEREHSLPFLWKGTTSQLENFKDLAKKSNKKIVLGGRFFHITGDSDKGIALDHVRSLYLKAIRKKIITIALGDSENDLKMFQKSDIIGFIKNKRKIDLNLKEFEKIFYSSKPAPEGWKEVILRMKLTRRKAEE